MPPRSLVATAALVAALATTTGASAADRFFMPGVETGEKTTIMARPDGEAGAFAHQKIEILNNSTLACEDPELSGAMRGRVVKQLDFTKLDFGACTYMSMPARLNTSSCAAVIYGVGLGRLTSRGSGRCDLRIEAPGCVIHLGRGLFVRVGFHNFGAGHDEITVLTEPIPIGGTARGTLCLTPGPLAIGTYSGYLRFSASRGGERTKLNVIL